MLSAYSWFYAPGSFLVEVGRQYVILGIELESAVYKASTLTYNYGLEFLAQTTLFLYQYGNSKLYKKTV